MKAQLIDGKQVKISFAYGRKGWSGMEENETKCSIEIDGQQKYVGRTFKRPTDPFSKKEARKYSLAKALRSCPDRAFRRSIWVMYLLR